MKSFVGIVCVVAVLLAHPFAIAAEAPQQQSEFKRDKNPPEVEALIGKPITKNGLPGWQHHISVLLNLFPQSGEALGLDDIERNGVEVFLVEKIPQKDGSAIVIDAQVLPKQATTGSKKNSRPYQFETACESPNEERVVGLMLPERGKEDCGHISKKVLRAWKIDTQTGRITEISPEGITCQWPHTDDCIN